MSMLDKFEPLAETGIRQLMKRSFGAFFEVDPTPAWLTKKTKPDLYYS